MRNPRGPATQLAAALYFLLAHSATAQSPGRPDLDGIATRAIGHTEPLDALRDLPKPPPAPIVPARAADPLTDARELVDAMGKALVAILTEPNLDRAARQDRFRAIYRRHFDHAAIGASALGRPWAQATPAKRGEYLAVLEEYIVKLAVAQLVHFEVERLLVVKSEDLGDSVVVTSLLIHPNPRAMRNIELKWRLAIVDGRLLVRDVVLDKISLALTERRAFASWLRDAGGTIEGLIAILRQKIAET